MTFPCKTSPPLVSNTFLQKRNVDVFKFSTNNRSTEKNQGRNQLSIQGPHPLNRSQNPVVTPESLNGQDQVRGDQTQPTSDATNWVLGPNFQFQQLACKKCQKAAPTEQKETILCLWGSQRFLSSSDTKPCCIAHEKFTFAYL